MNTQLVTRHNNVCYSADTSTIKQETKANHFTDIQLQQQRSPEIYTFASVHTWLDTHTHTHTHTHTDVHTSPSSQVEQTQLHAYSLCRRENKKR